MQYTSYFFVEGVFMKSFLQYLKIFGCGFFMGGADVIPGVSGGTIAFILGIYNRLIEAIHELTSPVFIKSILKRELKITTYLKSDNAKFLISLFLGIISAILLISTPMKYLLENHPTQIWAFFFGLIGGSILFIVKDAGLRKISNIIALIIGTIGAYFLVGLVPGETTNSLWFIVICGALAITAMILPGISGSFILLLLGKYNYVISAVHNLKEGLLSQNWELLTTAIVILAFFLIGIIIGLSLFIKLLSFLLKHYEQLVISGMLGFMIGSLRKIWPFKNGDINILPDSFTPEILSAILLAIFGFILIIGIELISKLKKTPKTEEN
jgi:putative membrane protein